MKSGFSGESKQGKQIKPNAGGGNRTHTPVKDIQHGDIVLDAAIRSFYHNYKIIFYMAFYWQLEKLIRVFRAI